MLKLLGMLFLWTGALGTQDRIPTSEDELNKFAEKYNKYVSSLQGEVVDLSLWRDTTKAWDNLVR